MSSKTKRTSFQTLLEDQAVQTATPNAALSRDNVVTLSETIAEEIPAQTKAGAPTSASVASPRRRSPNDNTRHTYHASLYLPEEAQFALREIALTMRKAKPHDVMLEAMAELFEKYNKGAVAKACRARITSRDKAVT